MNPALELSPLVTPAGVVSERFPATLRELFEMKGASSAFKYLHSARRILNVHTEPDAVALLYEYGRNDEIVPRSREKNVNAVMRMCGVQCYLVPRGGNSASRSSTTSPTTANGDAHT
ncbi:hypothetical protein TRAPUB_7914 [Trametes pubescens]|uniref:Uncharacterized protein n=1 Tax=Trametes pubescens TaxID=154538 RepID=A0A1M2V251_TRAPU|nr:hypothetical protein TRAPUB_7914 [Trametes pubescens]